MASAVASTSSSQPPPPPPRLASAPSSSLGPGPPPDLTERFKLKARYLRLQRDYFRALEVRKDLTVEADEKRQTVQRLQDEVDLLIDQIFDSDYAHLEPEDDDLFSPSEDENDDAHRDEDDPTARRQDASRLNGHATSPSSARANGVIRKTPPIAFNDPSPQAKRVRLDESGPDANGHGHVHVGPSSASGPAR